MELAEFIALHRPALESREACENLILGLLARFEVKPDPALMLWTLGEAGQCAMKTPGRGLILSGAASEEQCHRFAAETAALDYPSVAGTGETARWFVAKAEELGLAFGSVKAMRIHELTRPPLRPDVPGQARLATLEDAALVHRWVLAFIEDADTQEPIPTPQESEESVGKGRHWLWIVDDKPVALAALNRQTGTFGSIGPVYTPRAFRSKGFGGAITSAVVDQIFASGKQTACLYTDLANPASNRCYARLGFTPVCDSWSFQRVQAA